MIDLNVIKERHCDGMYVAGFEFLEVIDRAIAAESERDELKAKLARLDNELDETKRALNLSARLNTGYLEEMQSMVSAKPAEAVPSQTSGGDDGESISSIACTLHNYATHLHYSGNEKLADQLEEIVLRLWKLKAEPATNLQRITEQDMREIVWAYFNAGEFIGQFLSGTGRTLLAKLNEHREPELLIDSEPLDKETLRKWNIEFYSIASNKWPELYGDDHSDDVDEIIKNRWIGFCLAKKVTANKVEVPRLMRSKLRNAANELMGVSNILSDGIPEQSRAIHRKYMREYSRDIDAFVDSLPPLKDGE